jgi:hypothetical protein
VSTKMNRESMKPMFRISVGQRERSSESPMTAYVIAVRLRATIVRISPLRIVAISANTLLTHWTIGVGLGLWNYGPLGTQASLGVECPTVVNERNGLITTVTLCYIGSLNVEDVLAFLDA